MTYNRILSFSLSGHTLESVFYFRDFHRWVRQKSAAEGRHHLREDTASLLMALTTRNLVFLAFLQHKSSFAILLIFHYEPSVCVTKKRLNPVIYTFLS